MLTRACSLPDTFRSSENGVSRMQLIVDSVGLAWYFAAACQHEGKGEVEPSTVVCLKCGSLTQHSMGANGCVGYGQVASFNMGSLGFLTNHQFTDFKSDLAGIIAGTESLEECSPEGTTVRSLPT